MELARHRVDFPLLLQRCIRARVARIRRTLSLSADQADDLRQDLFLRLWKRFQHSPPRAMAPAAWVVFVLRHVVANFYRDWFARARRTPRHLSLHQPLRCPNGETHPLGETLAAPGDFFEKIDLRLEVEEIEPTLSAGEQRLVSDLKRLSPGDLAQLQGTPPSTLRGRIRRLGSSFARLKSEKSPKSAARLDVRRGF